MESSLKCLRPHKYVTVDKSQRCFVVGDIHGNWEALQESLKEINFNAKQDILVSVGDIIDRHEDSLKVALWMLNQPNIHVACGNHEKYFLDYLQLPETGYYYKSARTGGWWVDQHAPKDLQDLASNMQNQLALSITVEYAKKRIGILHAASPDDWYVVENELLGNDDWMDYLDNRAQYRQSKLSDIHPISSIDAVIHGHVCAPYHSGGNQHWIDTLHATGKLTVLELSNLFK
ncbi:MAG: metallophosphoesterase [Hahellaceae bacterium]|nr:metallophosphoesterase [Hahellaceae bacterium]